jgi:hypothetical protein
MPRQQIEAAEVEIRYRTPLIPDRNRGAFRSLLTAIASSFPGVAAASLEGRGRAPWRPVGVVMEVDHSVTRVMNDFIRLAEAGCLVGAATEEIRNHDNVDT